LYYKIFQPAPQLKPFIRYYWILRGIDQGSAGTNDLLIPDGCTEIIFNDSSVYARTDVTSGQELSINESCVVGQRNKSILARRIGHTHLVGVKLSAGALNLLSGIPESEFRNLSIALEGLKKTWLTELEERVFEQDSEAQMISLLNAAFQSRLNGNRGHDLQLSQAISRYILGAELMPDLSGIQERYQLHSKKLERLFNQYIGLSPKNYLKVMRFKKAYKRLNRHKTSFYDGSIYDLGFYDQNHFIKDFQFFTSQSPSDYYGQRSEISDEVLLQTMRQLRQRVS